jgi:WD40 repeat protein/serine/threonine protein kinase
VHIRCPHCHNAIEIVDDSSFRDLSCPACGSQFDLLGSDHSTETYRGHARTIAHFELIEHLGTGASGSVWKAKDIALDRMVAVKIPRKVELSEEELESFLREARAAGQLSHPNIVSVHEVGRDGDTIFIASDYVEGATLREWLKGRPISPQEAAQLCVEIAQALEHAHQRKVVHRDLKPSNILMDATGKPHVTDFGLARRETGEITVTLDGAVLGTPAYMPPEQARGAGHQADRRSDVYALGVILFEMLTGVLPFRGDKRMLLMQIIGDEPPAPRKLNGRIPRDIETICLKCLEKEPGQRYGTAQALTDDLQRFLDGQPIQARPVSRVEHVWRWAKRKPAVASLLAAAALLLASIATLATVGYFREVYLREIATTSLQKESQARAEAQRERATAESQRNEAIRQRQEALRNLYAAHLLRAQSALDEGNLDAMWDSVTAVEKALGPATEDEWRGWEWQFLRSRLDTSDAAVRAHTGAVTSIAFSPDGKRLATGGEDGLVILWDAAERRPLHVLDEHRDGVEQVAWSHDSARLASAGRDGRVIVWDGETGQSVRTLEGRSSPIASVAWHPAANRLAFAELSGVIRQIDLDDAAAPVEPYPTETEVRAMTWSRDGQLLLIGGEKEIRAWAVDTREVRFSLPEGGATCVAVSPQGDLLAGTNGSGDLAVWNLNDQTKKFRVVAHNPRSEGVCWAANGRQLATVGLTNQLRLWDVDEGREVTRYGQPDTFLYCVALSQDGRWFVTGGGKGVVRWWDVQRDPRGARLAGPQKSLDFVAWSPDGQRLAAADWWLSASSPLVIWDRPLDAPDVLPRVISADEVVIAPVWSADGRRIAGGTRNAVTIWDAATGAVLHRLQGHQDAVYCVSFSPDGRQLASAGRDFAVRIWNLATGEAIHVWHIDSEQIVSLRWHPRLPRVAVAGAEEEIEIWDATKGERMATIATGHTGTVLSMAWSPDGRRLVSAAADGSIKVWNTGNNQEAATLLGHTSLVTCVEWSPNGRRLASASMDHTVRIWDAVNYHSLLVLRQDQRGAMTVSWHPDGQRLAGALFQNVIIWDATRGSQMDPRVAKLDIVTPLAARLDQEPDNHALREDLIAIYRSRVSASVKDRSSDERALVEDGAKMIQLAEELLRRDTARADEHHKELSNALGLYGLALSRLGRVEEAVGQFQQSLKQMERLVASQPQNVAYRTTLGNAYLNLAVMGADVLPAAELESTLQSAVVVFKQLDTEQPESADCRDDLARALSQLGGVISQDAARSGEAEAMLRQSLALRKGLHEQLPDDPQRGAWRGLACRTLAAFLLDRKNPQDLDEALSLAEDGRKYNGRDYEAGQVLARALCAKERWNEARRAVEQSMALEGGYEGTNLLLLTLCLHHEGDQAASRLWRERATRWCEKYPKRVTPRIRELQEQVARSVAPPRRDPR